MEAGNSRSLQRQGRSLFTWPVHPSLSLCMIQDSLRPRLCVALNKKLHPSVHCSTIHNTQDTEIT